MKIPFVTRHAARNFLYHLPAWQDRLLHLEHRINPLIPRYRRLSQQDILFELGPGRQLARIQDQQKQLRRACRVLCCHRTHGLVRMVAEAPDCLVGEEPQRQLEEEEEEEEEEEDIKQEEEEDEFWTEELQRVMNGVLCKDMSKASRTIIFAEIMVQIFEESALWTPATPNRRGNVQQRGRRRG